MAKRRSWKVEDARADRQLKDLYRRIEKNNAEYFNKEQTQKFIDRTLKKEVWDKPSKHKWEVGRDIAKAWQKEFSKIDGKKYLITKGAERDLPKVKLVEAITKNLTKTELHRLKFVSLDKKELKNLPPNAYKNLLRTKTLVKKAIVASKAKRGESEKAKKNRQARFKYLINNITKLLQHSL